jgi:hypothetical protein
MQRVVFQKVREKRLDKKRGMLKSVSNIIIDKAFLGSSYTIDNW